LVLENIAPIEAVTCWRASGRGNGIGLSLIRHRHNGVSQVVRLWVLPKMWRRELRRDGEQYLSLVDQLSGTPQSTHFDVYVFEQDYLVLPHRFREQFIKQSEVEPVNGVLPEDVEKGVIDPLWQEALVPENQKIVPYAKLHKSDDVVYGDRVLQQALWGLVKKSANKPRIPDISQIGSALQIFKAKYLPHELRKRAIGTFLEYLMDELLNRKPQFVDTGDELMVLRGRISAKALIDRKINRRMPIWCEFDDLTLDNLMWQGFRLAINVCISELNQTEDKLAFELALECDARLRDVVQADLRTVLSTADTVARGIKSAGLQILYQFAMAILRHEEAPGTPTETPEDALVMNLKFATSDIWESLIAQAFRKMVGVKAPDQYKVFRSGDTSKKSKYAEDSENGGQNRDISIEMFRPGDNKRPDILISKKGQVTGESINVLVLDGKYKPRESEFKDASMSDQYQMYAYANICACPVFIIYPLESADIFTSKTNLTDQGFTAEAIALHTRAGPHQVICGNHSTWQGQRVGVAALPFPKFGANEIPADDDQLQLLMEKLVGLPI